MGLAEIQGRFARWGAGLLVGAGGAGVVGLGSLILWRFLANVPVEQASFYEYGWMDDAGLWSMVGAGVGCAWLGISGDLASRRAGRRGIVSLLIAFVLWWVPIVFFLTRIAASAVLAVAAAGMVVVWWAGMRGGEHDRRERVVRAMVAMLVIGLMSAGWMLGWKAGLIGWTVAND